MTSTILPTQAAWATTRSSRSSKTARATCGWEPTAAGSTAATAPPRAVPRTTGTIRNPRSLSNDTVFAIHEDRQGALSGRNPGRRARPLGHRGPPRRARGLPALPEAPRPRERHRRQEGASGKPKTNAGTEYSNNPDGNRFYYIRNRRKNRYDTCC